MIDISNIVVERLTTAIHAVDRKTLVKKGLITDPSSLPCTFIREMDNASYTKSETRRGENHAKVAYEINTFGTPEDAMKIQAAIDTEMQAMNFHRRFSRKFEHGQHYCPCCVPVFRCCRKGTHGERRHGLSDV